MRERFGLATLALLLACSSSGGSDADVDASAGRDAGVLDDAGGDGGDAGDRDAGGPDGGELPSDAGADDAGAMPDPCADRPPLGLPIAFDVLYGNASPTPMRFEGRTDWLDALGMEFPRDTGIAKRIRTRRGEYAVLAFETFDVDATRGSLDTDNPQITANTGTKLVSISRCPGDFRPAEDPDCVQRLGPVSNLRWGFEDAPFRCRIERDQRYYFNVLFTGDETLPAEWACNAAPGDDPEDCAMLFNTLSE